MCNVACYLLDHRDISGKLSCSVTNNYISLRTFKKIHESSSI